MEAASPGARGPFELWFEPGMAWSIFMKRPSNCPAAPPRPTKEGLAAQQCPPRPGGMRLPLMGSSL